jgi:hypothetical protein
LNLIIHEKTWEFQSLNKAGTLNTWWQHELFQGDVKLQKHHHENSLGA